MTVPQIVLTDAEYNALVRRAEAAEAETERLRESALKLAEALRASLERPHAESIYNDACAALAAFDAATETRQA